MGQDPDPNRPIMVQPVSSIAPDDIPFPQTPASAEAPDNSKPKTAARHKLSDPPEHHRGSSNGFRAASAENSNGAERGAKRKSSEQDMNWLPSGWLVEDRVRNSGVTAGTRDKYYIDPVSGRRFRSKKEVLYFLETGTVKNKRKPTENCDAGTKGSDGQKQKPSPAAESHVLNFDFSNVPEKVNWVLSDSPEESWTPYINDDIVAESRKQEWAAAFKFLTSKNSGRPDFLQV